MNSFPFDSIVSGYDASGYPIYDRTNNSNDLAEKIRLLFGNGVFPSPSTNLQVSVDGTNMTVSIAPGSACINGHLGKEPETRTLTLEAAAAKDRIDTIVCRLNCAKAYRNMDFYVLTGTAADTPVAPTLTQDDDYCEIGLANIYVGANVSAILASKVTDTRQDSTRCGLVVANPEGIDVTTLFDQYQAALKEWLAKMDKDYSAAQAQMTDEYNSYVAKAIEYLTNYQGVINGYSTTAQGNLSSLQSAFAGYNTQAKSLIAELDALISGDAAASLQLQIDNIKNSVVKIFCTCDESFNGTTVTCTNGTTTVTGYVDAGTVTFSLSTPGTYTVTPELTGYDYVVEANYHGYYNLQLHVATLTITTVEQYAGATLTCTDGTTTKTAIVPGTHTVTFHLPNTGTWTISNTLNSAVLTENITEYTTYTDSLSLVSIVATFSDQKFVGATVTCKKGDEVYTVTLTSTLKATFSVDLGDWTIYNSLTTTQQTVHATEYTNYNVSFRLAVITVTCARAEFEGATVTCKDGTNTYTAKVPSTLAVSFAVNTGTYTVSNTLTTETKNVSVTEYTDYSMTFGLATIAVTLGSNDFVGKTVTCTDGTSTYTATVTSTLAVSFSVGLGTWTISNSLNSKTKTVAATDYTTYPIQIDAYHLWGFIEHMATTDPASRIEYTNENANYTPLTVDLASTHVASYGGWSEWPWLLANKPYMVKNSGEVDYELSSSDYTKKVDGTTASDVNNTSYAGGAFSWSQKLYKKETISGTDRYVIFSDYQVDSTYKPQGCIDPDGNELEGFWIPMFYGSNTTSLRPLANSTTPSPSKTMAQQRTYLQANGTRHMFFGGPAINLLTDIMYMLAKTTDIQGAFGTGNSSGSSILSNQVVNGGQFYGTSTGSSRNKIFHSLVLGSYNQYQRDPYTQVSSGALYVTDRYKYTETATELTNTGYNYSSNAQGVYPTIYQLQDGYGAYPVSPYNGSTALGSCDYLYVSNGGMYVGLRFGNYGGGLYAGPRCLDLSNAGSGTGAAVGASDLLLPPVGVSP